MNDPVPKLCEQWWYCIVHAVNEGKRIGVDIGTFNCRWSQSGGPCVKSEMAMFYLACSETVAKGLGKVEIELTLLNKLYQYVYVLTI